MPSHSALRFPIIPNYFPTNLHHLLKSIHPPYYKKNFHSSNLFNDFVDQIQTVKFKKFRSISPNKKESGQSHLIDMNEIKIKSLPLITISSLL